VENSRIMEEYPTCKF